MGLSDRTLCLLALSLLTSPQHDHLSTLATQLRESLETVCLKSHEKNPSAGIAGLRGKGTVAKMQVERWVHDATIIYTGIEPATCQPLGAGNRDLPPLPLIELDDHLVHRHYLCGPRKSGGALSLADLANFAALCHTVPTLSSEFR